MTYRLFIKEILFCGIRLCNIYIRDNDSAEVLALSDHNYRNPSDVESDEWQDLVI